MRPLSILLVAATWLLCPGCQRNSSNSAVSQQRAILIAEPTQSQGVLNPSLSKIATPGLPDAELTRLLRDLGGVKEKPRFWLAIASDPQFTTLHRRRCALELFRRHVQYGMTLGEFASILSTPQWIADADMSRLTVIQGHIPVQVNLGESKFKLRLFPEGEVNTGAVYLRVTGIIEEEDFRKILRLQPIDKKVTDAVILEIGYFDPN